MQFLSKYHTPTNFQRPKTIVIISESSNKPRHFTREMQLLQKCHRKLLLNNNTLYSRNYKSESSKNSISSENWIFPQNLSLFIYLFLLETEHEQKGFVFVYESPVSLSHSIFCRCDQICLCSGPFLYKIFTFLLLYL